MFLACASSSNSSAPCAYCYSWAMQVRFSAAASKARRHLSEHGEPALLKGKKVCFHCADGQRASLGNVPVLKRLAVALGAKACYFPLLCLGNR